MSDRIKKLTTGAVGLPVVTKETGSVKNWQREYTREGMAHFAGTGPMGTTCGACGYWAGDGCAKYRELSPRDRRKYPRIPHNTPSCRYFSLRADHDFSE